MDLPEPRTQVPADRPPEFLRVVRSGLEGLEHPEQAPVGVALLSQGESLVERQVGGLLPRMVALEGGLSLSLCDSVGDHFRQDSGSTKPPASIRPSPRPGAP